MNIPANILNDVEIEALCSGHNPMISPFEAGKVKIIVKEIMRDGVQMYDTQKAVSYGCAEYGYDVRLGTEFARPNTGVILDPKNNDKTNWITFNTTEPVIINPNEFILGNTLESFNMPNDVVGLGFAKSTYSRLGLELPSFVLEPGWAGIATFRISNTGHNPVRIYPKEGLTQVIFFRGNLPKEAYGDGKYQNQTGITLAKV